MGTQIKSIVHVIDLQPGAETTLPHFLNVNGMPVKPDVLTAQNSLVDMSADDINVVVFNKSGDAMTFDILCEHWHTIERAFGEPGTLNLTPQPFIVLDDGSGSGIPTPPFAPFYRTIYARLTGSDTTGLGTLAKPYRTFQRAIRDVPNIIPPGVSYFVDITGIGVETLPNNYCLPTFKTGNALIFDVSTFQYWNTVAAVNVTADPKLVTTGLNPAGGAVITMGDVLGGPAGQGQDPVTGLSFIKLKPAAAAAKAWVPGALAGRLISGAGGPFEQAVIYDNTADTIYFTITYDITLTMGGAKILECSAGLKSAQTVFSYGIFPQANYCDLIAFRSISFPEGVSTRGGSPIFDFCDVVDLDSSAPGYAANMWQSHFHNGAVGTFLQASIYAANSFLNGLTTGFGAWAFSPANTQSAVFFSAVIGCDPTGFALENTSLGGVVQTSGFWFVFRSLIRDAVSHGVDFRGGNMVVARVQIEGSGGDAISASQGAGFLDLFEVHGAGNTGLGLRLADGITARADGPTDVTGGAGDQQVGSQVIGAWPAPGVNVPDFTGPAAQGSRLYVV